MLFCGPFPAIAKDTLPRAALSLSFFFLGISASDFFGGTLGGVRSSDFRFFFSAIVCGSCLTSSMVDSAAFSGTGVLWVVLGMLLLRCAPGLLLAKGWLFLVFLLSLFFLLLVSIVC